MHVGAILLLSFIFKDVSFLFLAYKSDTSARVYAETIIIQPINSMVKPLLRGEGTPVQFKRHSNYQW